MDASIDVHSLRHVHWRGDVSPAGSHRPGHHHRADLCRTGRQQGAGGLGQRVAGGQHVIDQHDVTAGHAGRVGYLEGALQVSSPVWLGLLRLSCRVPCPGQPFGPYRRADQGGVALHGQRNLQRLVIAALGQPGAGERNGDEGVWPVAVLW